jgi:EmrB/QacA subfamily drug resistance transporter
MGAALLALFLGALDALVVSAAMPTIVAEVGGMHLYSWVYSAYFLARAVTLPIFGKLADRYRTRNLFLGAIALFITASIAAGAAPNMGFLVGARVFQGIGSGGIFALVYIVLSDISSPQKRGRTLSFASSIWGVASVLGPTLGGFIVTYFSWRWIFFVNIPLGLVSLAGIAVFSAETRVKERSASLDLAGVLTLTVMILSLLSVFLGSGRRHSWLSPQVIALLVVAVAAAFGFYRAEKRAADPILSLEFFTRRGFSTGNVAVFLSSFAIFSLFAFAPLFIQGALGQTPMEVGLAMLSLSLGWSAGSLVLGQIVERLGSKAAALCGALMLAAGCGLTVTFSTHTTTVAFFLIFLLVGLGMGFVTLSTLLVVQSSLETSNLGVATSSHQFARTLGGTVGVGICGGVIAARLAAVTDRLQASGLPADLLSRIRENTEMLFSGSIQARLSETSRQVLQQAAIDGVSRVFWVILVISVLCFVACSLLPPRKLAGRRNLKRRKRQAAKRRSSRNQK